jgi:hypothetical protein
MSGLPSLDPPMPISDVTGRYLVEGRRYARRVGAAQALDALRRAHDRSTDRIAAVHWHFGNRSTFAGTSERGGCGDRRCWPIGSHVSDLQRLASQVHPKGEGPCRTLGRSRFGGSSDAEFEARTGLFLDCDDCGPADALLDALAAADLAYICQRRPGGHRWHIELFYGPLVEPPKSDSIDALRTWKNAWYRPMTGWLMGIFSELGGLDCRFEHHRGAISISKLGVDAAPGNRLLGLGNPYTRRVLTDPTPVTTHREGAFINVERLLDATGFAVPDDAPRRAKSSTAVLAVPSAGAVVPPASDALAEEISAPLYVPDEPEGPTPCGAAIARAFSAAGLRRNEAGGLVQVVCPFVDGHTPGAGADTGTAVLPNGFVKCHHASCASRTQPDFFRALPHEAQDLMFEALPDMADETEDALFGAHIVDLAARVSINDPLRFAKTLKRMTTDAGTKERWMAFVRKARRA